MPEPTTDDDPAVPASTPSLSVPQSQKPSLWRGRSLRAHLLAFALAVLVPALGAGVLAAGMAANAYRSAEEGRLRDTARALALALDSEIDSVETALVTLAGSPDLQPGGNLADFETQARAVARALGTVVLARGPAPDFRLVINTHLPPGTEVPSLSSGAGAVLAEAAATGRPRTTNLFHGHATGREQAAVVVPVAAGGPVRLIGMILPPSRLTHLLEAQRLEGDYIASLADGQGRLVARSRDHDRYLGQLAPHRTVDGVVSVAEGLTRGEGLDGREKLYAVTSLHRAAGWTLAVSVPWEHYNAAWRGPLLWLAGSAATVLALGLGGAILLARRVVHPIGALVRRAQAVASGLMPPSDVDVTVPFEVAEVAELRRWVAQAEEAVLQRGEVLAEQNRRLADLTGTLDLGMSMVRSWGGTIRFWSRGCERLYGWSAEEAVGQDAHNLLRTVFPVPLAEIEAALERDGEWTGDLVHRTRDGREVVVVAHKALRRGPEGSPEAVLESVADVTSARRNEAALAESEARLRSVVDTAADGILVANAAGCIVSVNASAAPIFGYDTPEELIGRDLGTLMPQPEAARHDGHLAAHSPGARPRVIGVPGRGLTAVRRDGTEFPIELSVSSFTLGAERFYTGIVRDVTERRRAEELRMLLAREVDHRAKNALAVVLSLLRLTPRDDPARFAASVEGRVAAMARAHSLLATHNWTGADLRPLAEAELAMHAGRVTLSGPAVRLSAEAVQPVAMLLHELATNAAKYGALSRNEGQVDLSWEIDSTGGGLHLLWAEGGGPPARQPVRRGFGSRLLASLVGQQLGGTIDYTWAENGLAVAIRIASRFVFLAARTSPEDAHSGTRAMHRSPRSETDEALGAGVPGAMDRSPRVLVVEDEALLAMEVEGVLHELGCEMVGPARTLAEAVRLAAGARGLAAAVLDVNLGNGELSFPAVDLLQTRGVPYVFATGYGSAKSLKGREHGAVAVLIKPYQPGALKNAVCSALRGGARAHEVPDAGPR